MMAVSEQPETSTLPDGLVLTGQYLSGKVQEGNFIPDKPGERYPSRWVVSLLVGDRTMQVEFKNEEQARAYLGGVDPEPMDRVSMRVGTRGAKGYVFFYGIRP